MDLQKTSRFLKKIKKICHAQNNDGALGAEGGVPAVASPPSLRFPALFRNPAGRGKEKPFEKGSFLPPCTPHPFPKLFMFAFPFCVPQKEKAGQKFGKEQWYMVDAKSLFQR